MTPELIADVRARVDALAKAVEGQHAARNAGTTAKVSVTGAFDRGMDAVRQLDVVIGNMVNEDPVLLALWTQNRRVHSVAKGVVASRRRLPSSLP